MFRKKTGIALFGLAAFPALASDWSGAQNDLSLQVQIDERFALKTGLQFRHNTEVPDGIDRTDTLLTTNLVVGF